MALHSRTKRVGEEIKASMAMILMTELKDPRLQHGLITISHVEVTKDLSHAQIWVSVLGAPEEVKKALEALNHSKGYIRHLLGERLMIKYIPEIEFRHDTTGEYAAKINTLLKKIEREQPTTPDDNENASEAK